VPDVDLPTPWEFDGGEGDVEPALDGAARATLLREGLELALANPVDRVVGAHADLLEAARDTDDGCPAEAVEATLDGSMVTTIWYGPCEDEAGISFFGSGSITLYDRYFDESSGRFRTGVELQSIDAEIVADDGRRFLGAFYAGLYDDDLQTSRLSFEVFVGSVEATVVGDDGEIEVVGPAAEIGSITHHDVEARDTLLVFVDGALQVGGRALTFSELTVGDALASACPEEPSGAVAIRDVDGNTYDIHFDGLDDDGARTADCDACGATAFRGADLDASCVDTSTLLDLENAPW